MSGYVQSNQIIKLPAIAAFPINAADTGKVMIMPQTVGADLIYVLPTPAAGLHYRFINGAALALNGVTAVTASAVIIYGSIITGPTGGVALTPVNGNTLIGFQTATSLRGDYIDMYCDGTNWYCDGRSRVAAGIEIA
jgi:hypothetical protein